MICAGCVDRFSCSQEVRLSEGSGLVFSVESVTCCAILVRNLVHQSNFDVMVGNGTPEENGALVGPKTVDCSEDGCAALHFCSLS